MIILVIVGVRDPGECFRIVRRVAFEGRKVMMLFVGDGCRIAEDPGTVESLASFARLYALSEDCPKPAKGVTLVDYDGWVKLLEMCNKTFSWT